jgi:DNA-directed RNA polymerase subunit beta'
VGVGDVVAKYPAGSVEDPRHHRRPAARCRPVRGAQAEGAGHPGRASGIISFGKDTKGKQRLIIKPTRRQEHEELIPKYRQIIVFEGEHVEKGETVVDGEPNPQDILRLKGVEPLAAYLVKEIQDVYRLQGVKINDKHIETIIRQMLRKVEISDGGDTRFLRGEQVDRVRVLEENARPGAQGLIPAKLRSGAAGHHQGLAGHGIVHFGGVLPGNHPRADRGGRARHPRHLRGLKENVIVGRLIPAGTGLAYHAKRRAANARPHRGRDGFLPWRGPA